MDIKLPKRKDPIYTEIEQFEEYEFTNCIAYEMVIRNKKIKSLLESYLLTKDELIFSDDEPEFKLLKDYGFDSMALSCFRISMFSGFSINYNSGKIRGKYSDEILLNKSSKYNNITLIDNFLVNESYNNGESNGFDVIENTNINEEHIPSIDFGYGRPILKIKKAKLFNIEFNLNLPKEELVAYISKIKDEYDKDNSIVKTPLELLGEDFEKSDNKKINKKIIADKFFIYDYVTSRQEQIKKDNEFLYEVYEEDIQKIKKNPCITPSDRKIQLKEKKRELEENANTRKDELFADIPKFKTGTAKRYYYDIKPFIDDCKYKELITGMKL